jgi:hypothetical protein
MTDSLTPPQTTRKTPLGCPESGCSNFIEVVFERTSSRAVFYDRDYYPQVSDLRFEREVDEINIYCERCNWVAQPVELVDAPRGSR